MKYLRYRGENTWFLGAASLFLRGLPLVERHNSEISGQKDAVAVFARMFEENNLTLTLSVPYESDHFRLSMADRYTDWDVKMGQPTIFQVKVNGTQPNSFGGHCVNPLHPRARQEVESSLTELAKRVCVLPGREEHHAHLGPQRLALSVLEHELWMVSGARRKPGQFVLEQRLRRFHYPQV